MIVKPKYRGFICTAAHPAGCYKNVEDMVSSALSENIAGGTGNGKKPKNVVVIGSSSGYGLASRIVAAFTYKARTIGVSFEREASGTRTATAGFYNNRAFDDLAMKNNIPFRTINGDAFSNEIKDEVILACKDLFNGEKIDLLVYSLAAPKRTDPETNEVYTSVIKPTGDTYNNKTVDFHTGNVSNISILSATEEEIQNTIKVMGGDDWERWINVLVSAKLISDEFITVSYSYIGPPITHAIYKDGTIGKAKDDLLIKCKAINETLKPFNGNAYVSINKALVTQASSAIPVVPLYISLLYKIMKEKGIHEGCYEQMKRLFTDRIYSGIEKFCDTELRIRMDDYEMQPDVQAEIDKCWPMLTSENIEALTDIKGYRKEFFSLFGFDRDDVDYDADVDV